MKRHIKCADSSFTTYEISNSLRSIVCSHIYIADRSEREQIAEELFRFIDDAYDGAGGFKSFKDVDHFISDSYLWYITYDGPSPRSLDDFDIRKVYVVSVFRNSHGLKLVGLARRVIGRSETDKAANIATRQRATSALYEHINYLKDKSVGWAEISGKLEEYFKEVYGSSGIIDPYDLIDYKIFKGIEVDIDELHYYRPLRSGQEPVRKIAYGHIRF